MQDQLWLIHSNLRTDVIWHFSFSKYKKIFWRISWTAHFGPKDLIKVKLVVIFYDSILINRLHFRFFYRFEILTNVKRLFYDDVFDIFLVKITINGPKSSFSNSSSSVLNGCEGCMIAIVIVATKYFSISSIKINILKLFENFVMIQMSHKKTPFSNKNCVFREMTQRFFWFGDISKCLTINRFRNLQYQS